MSGMKLASKTELPKDIKKKNQKSQNFKFIICLILSNLCTFILLMDTSTPKEVKISIPKDYIQLKLPLNLHIKLDDSLSERSDLYTINNNLLVKNAILFSGKTIENDQEMYLVQIHKSYLPNVIRYKKQIFAYPSSLIKQKTFTPNQRKNYELKF